MKLLLLVINFLIEFDCIDIGEEIGVIFDIIYATAVVDVDKLYTFVWSHNNSEILSTFDKCSLRYI